MTPEFSRPERVETIGERETTVDIAADADERAALARRFGLLAVESLAAHFTLRRQANGIAAGGTVRAAVIQPCSVTDEPVPATIDEPVALLFVELQASSDEVELASEALDTIEYEGGVIDLGEAAAETMALALDPFPRSPGAAAVLKAAGVVGEDEAKPLNPFAGLKAQLEGRE